MTKTLSELYDEQQAEIQENYYQFLRFASISAEEEHRGDIADCANWVKNHLEGIGLKTEIWPTANHPVVFGSLEEAGEDKPTILFYTHYDVQPVDPLEEWLSPPFEPTEKDGEVYARGSHDDKGQCIYVMEAIRLLLKRDGKLPINVKFIAEGGEEIGSIGLSGILEERKEQLKADHLIIVDAGIPGPDAPAVTLGIRGMVAFDVEMQGPIGDLHSGQHGGIIQNPLHALIRLLDSLHDEKGTVTIDGFYDGIDPITEEEKEQLDLSFDIDEYSKQVGQLPFGMEEGLSPAEGGWLRPTLEINGISGGYAGSGFKTVIPAKAGAKVSCRLVPHQNPHTIARLVKEHLETHAPKGTKVTVTVHGGMGEAARTSPKAPIVQAVAKGYSEVFGKACSHILSGGSIPVAVNLARASQADMVMMGLGLPDDNIHAPNEHFGLDRLKKGALIVAHTIEKLSEEK